jgi:hypothetical protein
MIVKYLMFWRLAFNEAASHRMNRRQLFGFLWENAFHLEEVPAPSKASCERCRTPGAEVIQLHFPLREHSDQWPIL